MQPTFPAVLALGLAMATPAFAQDDSAEANPLNTIVEIEAETGEIVAQYSGVTKVSSRTRGANRAVVRANPYRCVYSVDLEVERIATHNENSEARRQLTSRNVIAGVVPGPCSTPAAEKEIAREIERRERDFVRAMERVIGRDRDDVIAEIADQERASATG